MSVSHDDINRIEEWLADMYGTTPGKCPVSREAIRRMCRGPMKDIFLGFLVPRFRTDEQIKTVRSNLFLHDIANQSSQKIQKEEDSRHRHEMKQLKDKVSKLQKEKQEVSKRIVKLMEKATESNVNLDKEVIMSLSSYDKTDSRLSQTVERVLTSNELLKDVQNVVPSLSSVRVGKDKQDSLAQMTELRSLYTNALDLFSVYCGTKGRANDSTSLQVEPFIKKVDTQTSELAHSGISPNVIETWAKSEQEQSLSQLNILESEFTNVMNPVEEFSAEAQSLYIKLMKVHIALRENNTILQQKIQRLKKRLDKKLWKVIQDGDVDFAKLSELLQEEKSNARSQKLQEMTNLISQWEIALENEEDLLRFISTCETNTQKSDNGIDGTLNGISSGVSRLSTDAASSSSAGSSCSQEILEDLTCALMKSYPMSKHQLEITLKNSKLLMLEMFPELCNKLEGYQKGNSDFMSARASTSPPVPNDIDAPERILLQGSFLDENSAIKNKFDMKSPDYLTEILKLEVENEKRAKECELLMQERKSVSL